MHCIVIAEGKLVVLSILLELIKLVFIVGESWYIVASACMIIDKLGRVLAITKKDFATKHSST